jgi:hypothetical protein
MSLTGTQRQPLTRDSEAFSSLTSNCLPLSNRFLPPAIAAPRPSADDLPAPADTTLRRWLDQAVADGRVAREGAGLRNHPHLYWLPGKQAEWPDIAHWRLQVEEKDPFDFAKEDQETLRQERRKRGRENAAE